MTFIILKPRLDEPGINRSSSGSSHGSGGTSHLHQNEDKNVVFLKKNNYYSFIVLLCLDDYFSSHFNKGTFTLKAQVWHSSDSFKTCQEVLLQCCNPRDANIQICLSSTCWPWISTTCRRKTRTGVLAIFVPTSNICLTCLPICPEFTCKFARH